MTQGMPACPGCGAIVGSGGGRCPQCGYALPDLQGATRTAAIVGTPVRPRPPAARKASPLPPIAMGVAALAALGGAFWFFRGSMAPAKPAPAPSAATMATAASTLPPTAPGEIDPISALSQGRKRAQAWNGEAQLASITASGFVQGRVDGASGGKIELAFGKPVGGVGPGSKLAAARFVVTVDSGGTRDAEADGAPGQRSVSEPNCGIDDAWRSTIASGVPSTAKITLRYARSDKHDRDVWFATGDDEKQARALDGNTCAILRN